ncbi:MAG TPA: DAK2 domain-containing protein [Gaiellaceae bacterium]|nr:DAK2 domain-containing protein [Gaiellaceae bacterium]
MTALDLARGALASLERSRRRIDDLNVYPVPDGDTGTNLTLTARAIVEALEETETTDRAGLAKELTRAALMGARGNSGVILSQIVRGFADVVGEADPLDSAVLTRAFRGASDAAYRAVRRPVEGTMLTVIREIAEAAERADQAQTPAELLVELVHAGEESLARTQDMLDVLRDAGVVDAGGAGLVEIVRGLAATATGEPIPEAPQSSELSVDAIHQELSRYRYCTTFVVEGDDLVREELEGELERLGDSLLVVGDRNAMKVHVHTDEPGSALAIGTSRGTIAGVEIANMHAQTQHREERLLHVVPDVQSEVVAVVVGEGNRKLFESLGATSFVEGGQTMNPSTADLVAAVERTGAAEVVLLPNNSNVIMSAEQAAGLATKPVQVVASDSIPGGLAALVSFDPQRNAAENAEEMRETLDAVTTGEVTIASRDAQLNGLAVPKGNYLGLADGEAISVGESFEQVVNDVVEKLLDEPRSMLMLLRGEGAPDVESLVATISERHPDVEVDVQEGGQPHYQLLLSAE